MNHFPRHQLPMRLSLITLCLGLAAPVWAQSAAASAPVAVSIPAQPLDKALTALAAQTGMLIGADSSLLAGKQAPALSGTYTPAEALQRLLAGSGLEAMPGSDGSVQLRKLSNAGTDVLPAISVKGQQETARGPVRGYVATRSATATKTDTPLIENPQSVSVITADEIGDRKAESLDETLRYTAGVTPNSKPWAADQYSLLRGFELGNTGIFLDGLMNPNVSYMATIDPYGLERIEVLRGPASVLYGQMSPGGMVNAVSKRPTRETVREIGVEYGTYDRKQIKADFGGALDEHGEWTYRLTMLKRESGTRLDHDEDDRLFIAPSLTWQPNADTRLTLLALYQKESQKYAWSNQLQNPGALGQADPRVNVGGIDNRWERTNTMIGYELEHRFNDTWSLRQNLRYNDLEREGTDVLTGGLGSDGRTIMRQFSPRGNEWSGLLLDTQLQARFEQQRISHTVLFGVDHARSHLAWNRPYAAYLIAPFDLFAPDYQAAEVRPSAAPYRDKLPSRQTGLYAQEQMKWDRWVLTAGLRHDRVRQSRSRTMLNTGVTTQSYDESPSATTGRVGLVYLFDSGLAPYASYATSFAPEVGNSLSGDPLKPSRGKQAEVGLRYQPSGSAVSYTASIFDLVRENVTTGAPGNPSLLVQTGEVSSRGLELEARAEIAANLSVVAQYTWLDTEVTQSNNGDQGLAQKGAPRHSASAWARYSFALGDSARGFAGLGVRYLGTARSGQDWSNRNIMNPSLTLVDAALGFDRGPWRISLNIDNLFDKQVLIDCDGSLCYRSAERTANLSALYRF